MAAANAFAASLCPQLGKGKKVRFVYLDGAMSERNPEKKLWFLPEIRRIRVPKFSPLWLLA